MDRYAVGCVILESEHPNDIIGLELNPWERYRDARAANGLQTPVFLQSNPLWQPDNSPWLNDHAQLIEEAGLL
ncbi:hypothetical protein [Inquilinus sp. CAU 1745]|uniref:hypothetical protein n=1 Tax=Inquilinus sp. CAU 1745 TaxID=3140369 RepID=UPI00325AEB0B